ncbi:hypothetical protein [uncultured Clostridium sp.]|uniref:hypothetical protein n=1 Tax=uncultured Clostridium sp. TaxID=59620 RepID=UPI0028ED7159|nr:hypothetical protein [uncultured Clostridium sp.]
MLKKLQIGVISFIIIMILLHFKTENFKLIVPIIIAIIINTVIDVYMSIKQKEYRTYKWISGVDLLFAIIWVRSLVLYFLGAQKRSSYSRDIFIISMVLGILVMVRSYLTSEKFKFPSNFKSKDT